MLQNINWGVNDYVSAEKMRKMVDNDNINYNMAAKSPLGLLHAYNFAAPLSSRQMTSASEVTVFPSQLIYGKASENSERFIKIVISDCTITNPTVEIPTSTKVTSPVAVIFKFEYSISESEVNQIEYITRYSPMRLSPTSRQGNWRCSGAEFLIKPTSPDFTLSCSVRQRVHSSTPTDQTVAVTAGSISVYDAGAVL